MLVSPTEPFPLKAIGTVSSLPEKYGCDFLIVKGKARTGVQRKKFPEDVIASLADGRLYEQLHKMGDLDRVVVIIEGLGQWTSEGELLHDFGRGITKTSLYSLLFSLAFEFGAEVLQVRNINETVEALKALEHWAGKDRHTSLRTRPGPKRDSWGNIGVKEYGVHFLQSFPGVGVELAGRVFDHFGGVPVKWDLEGVEKLMEVKGIGKEKAKKIWEVLA